MKKLNYCMLLAFIVSSCVVGCTNESVYITGKEQFYLTPYQIEKFEKKASSGNEKAMIRLVEYYSIFGADSKRGGFWYDELEKKRAEESMGRDPIIH